MVREPSRLVRMVDRFHQFGIVYRFTYESMFTDSDIPMCVCTINLPSDMYNESHLSRDLVISLNVHRIGPSIVMPWIDPPAYMLLLEYYHLLEQSGWLAHVTQPLG